MRLFRAVLLAVILTAGSTAALCDHLLIVVFGGDSLTGCSPDYPFAYWGPTTGDCGFPEIQTAATYYHLNVVGRNMAISATRLNTGANNFAAIRPAYIDPIAANKSVNGVDPTPGVTIPQRTYLLICGTVTYGSVALYAAALASSCAAAKTAGFDQAWLTTPTAWASSEANRAAFNALVRDPAWRANNNIDGFVDLAAEPYVGNSANMPLNNGGSNWCFSDNTHNNAFCGRLLSNGPFTDALRSAFPDVLNFVLERDLKRPAAANDNTPAFLNKVA